VLEIPLGGSVVVSSYTYTSRLHRYITTSDYVRLGFELSSILLIILDLFEKLLCCPPPRRPRRAGGRGRWRGLT